MSKYFICFAFSEVWWCPFSNMNCKDPVDPVYVSDNYTLLPFQDNQSNTTAVTQKNKGSKCWFAAFEAQITSQVTLGEPVIKHCSKTCLKSQKENTIALTRGECQLDWDYFNSW